MKYLIIPAARLVWLVFRLLAASLVYLATFFWTCNIQEAEKSFDFMSGEDTELIPIQFVIPVCVAGLVYQIYFCVQLWLNR